MTPDQERVLKAVENFRVAEMRAALVSRGVKGIEAANNASRRFNELMAVIFPENFPMSSHSGSDESTKSVEEGR